MPQGSNDWVLDRVADVFVHGPEEEFERTPLASRCIQSVRDAGTKFRNVIRPSDVGSHEPIAIADERDAAPLQLEMNFLLRKLQRFPPGSVIVASLPHWLSYAP